MSTSQVSLFIAAALVGSTVFQVPIGQISDRVPRRGVMAAIAAVATVTAALGSMTSVGTSAIVVMFVLGAASFPLYSLAIAYTNDWIEDHQRVGASGLLVMVNGVGAIVGPLATTALISGFGTAAFWWSLAAIHLAVLGLSLIHI